MKRIARLILLLALFQGLVENCQGQETKIGGGRLLRKWRDDVFGSDKDKQSKNEASKKSSKPADQFPRSNPGATANSFSRNYSQAQNYRQNSNPNSFRLPNSGNQPTLAAPHRLQDGQGRSDYPQRQHLQQSQLADERRHNQQRQNFNDELDYYRQRQANFPQEYQSGRDPRAQQSAAQPYRRLSDQYDEPSDDYSQLRPRNEQLYKAAQSSATNRAQRRGAPAVGFGLELKTDRKDQIYVASVDRDGNAAEAGIRKGDYVLELGGTPLSSVEEFEEIVKVMHDGDQLELKISRKGQTSDILLTFGEASETSDDREYEPAAPQSGHSVLQPPGASDRYDFVPQSSRFSDSDRAVSNPRLLETPDPPSRTARPNLPEIELDLELPQTSSRR